MSQACTDNKIIVQAIHTRLKCTSFQYEAFCPCLYTPMANPCILFIFPFIISSCLDNNWKFAKMDKISNLVLTSIIQTKAIHNSQLNCKNLKREYGQHFYGALFLFLWLQGLFQALWNAEGVCSFSRFLRRRTVHLAYYPPSFQVKGESKHLLLCRQLAASSPQRLGFISFHSCSWNTGNFGKQYFLLQI